MARAVIVLGLFIGLFLMFGEVAGKSYYRWTDADGVTQLSDQPPANRSYEQILIPDENREGGVVQSSAESAKSEKEDKALTEEQQQIKKRQDDVVKDLEEMAAHYADVGGITAGKLAALQEAAVVVKKAKMDGSEADEAFYLKIEELVRSIKDHTAIIGRVHRLLNEAKVMKGFAPPAKQEESE